MQENRNAAKPHLTKQEAAAEIGVSLRTLEYMLARNEVAHRLIKGKTRPVVVIDREEIDRVRTAREAAEHRGAVQPTEALVKQGARQMSQVTANPATAPPGPLQSSAEFLAGIRSALVLPHQLTLTLAEAATLAGLSKDYLRQAIKTGRLKASKRGRGWNVKRADLEAWVKKL